MNSDNKKFATMLAYAHCIESHISAGPFVISNGISTIMYRHTFIFSTLLLYCRQYIAVSTVPPNPGLLIPNVSSLEFSPTITQTPITLGEVDPWPAPNADYEIARNLYLNIKTYSAPPPSINSKLRVIDALLDIFQKIQLQPSGPLPSTGKSFYSASVTVRFEAMLATEEMPMLNRAQALTVVDALEELTVADGPRGVEVGYVREGEGEGKWIGQFSLKVRGRK